MSKLTRRKFISFLGLGSVVTVWPFSLLSRNLSGKTKTKVKAIFNLLKKKRNSIKTLSYSVLQKFAYVDSKIVNLPDSDEVPENMKFELYWKPNKLKLIRYFPTEKTPKGFGAKFTIVRKNKKNYEKREALDGSFETEYNSRWLSSLELEKDQFFALEGVVPMPQDNLMTLVGEEFLDGELTYVIIQDNRKYWISLEKVSAVKVEFYRASNEAMGTLEFKNFKEVYPGILLPTLVIDKQFDENNNLKREFRKEITDIKVNDWMPDEIFAIEEENYNG